MPWRARPRTPQNRRANPSQRIGTGIRIGNSGSMDMLPMARPLTNCAAAHRRHSISSVRNDPASCSTSCLPRTSSPTGAFAVSPQIRTSTIRSRMRREVSGPLPLPIWPQLFGSITVRRPRSRCGARLLNVAELDAPGHLHEVLSGSFFTPQSESVPEQTWSSAGVVSSTVQGLLGLQTDSLARRLRFAPAFPDDWDHADIKNIRLGPSLVSLAWHRTSDGQSLALESQGEPIKLEFEPLLPLGASLGHAQFNGASTASSLENHPQETRARIELALPHGHSDLSLTYSGGISISLPHAPLLAGDASSGLRILTARIANSNFMIDADAPCDRASRIRLSSPRKLASPADAHLQPLAANTFAATIPVSSCAAGSYHRVHLEFGIQK